MTSASRWKRPKDTSQRTLFGGAPERRPSHPRVDPAATSRVAAGANATRTDNQRQRVLEFIAERAESGATADEICERMAMLPQSVTPRLGELAHEGLIVRSGRKRATRSGCPAHVWIATEFAPRRDDATSDRA